MLNPYTQIRRALTLACIAASFTATAKPETRSVQQQPQALSFTQNIGQVTDQHNNSRKDIDFKVSVPGMSIFVGDGQLHYQWSKTPPMPATDQAAPGKMRKPEPLKDLPPTEMYRMDVTLVGANIKAPVAATEEQAYYERYFSSKFGEDGGLAHTYNRITYTNVYPNIDWVLYTKDGSLKYDFVVRPGGNPADIKLQYGGGAVALNKDGSITATTPMGSITEQAPYTYIAESKVSVPSAYKLRGNTVTFDVAKTDGTLVIDPALAWATYYGGSGQENYCANACDNWDNVYLSGGTNGSTNLATTGAYQTTNAGSWDAYLVKFNGAGTRQWATYYGSSNDDLFIGVTCDPTGNVYISGYTTSTSGVTTTGAHQTVNAGGYDGLLVKFNTTGSRLWATYYGGTGQENSGYVATDASGNVYLAGLTQSLSGIATPGTHQSVYTGGTYDAYLAKFNSAGVRQWGTYFGGTGVEYIWRLSPVNNGNIYLSGSTASSSAIATTGAHQTTLIGPDDGFFAKFNTSNGTLIFASYFGGSGYDGYCMAASDNAGNFYITGATTTTGLATTGAYQTAIAGGYESYLAKFNSSGVQQWCTYYGGSSHEFTSGLCVSAAGRIYVAGQTQSTSGIATAGAYQTTFAGANDMFVTEWNDAGTLLWGTYYGGPYYDAFGSANDNISGVSWSPGGAIYLNGATLSTSGIATNGAHQTTFSGNWDGFLARFAVDTLAFIKQPYTDTLFCPGDTFYVNYGVTFNFKTTNSFTVQLSDAAGSFAVPINIGTKAANTPDSIKCLIPINTAAGAGYRIRIVSTAPVGTSIDNGVNIRVKAGPINLIASVAPTCAAASVNLAANSTTTAPVIWSWAGPNSFTSNVKNPIINNATATMAGDYIVTATADGCTMKDTATLTIKPLPSAPVVTNNGPLCTGDTLKLSSASVTTGVTYMWSGPGGFTSNQKDTAIINAKTSNSGVYTVVAVKDGCTSATAGSTHAIVHAITPKPIANSNTPVCAGGTIYLNTNTVAATNYVWTGPANFTSTLQAPSIPFVTPQNGGLYIVTAYANGCASEPDTEKVNILVAAILGAYASPNDTICGGEVLTLVATVNNTGINPQYQWYKNGQPAATTPLMTDNNVVNGDKYYCTMYSTSLCQMPITIATDTIRMTVHDVLVTPSVSITSAPAQPIPGQLATFTAVPVHPGYLPQYQWQRNGQKVIGAISAIWSAGYLHPTDVISCVLVSSDKCASVDTVYSNKIVVNFPSNIATVGDNGSLSLYPNPNNGSFTLQGDVDAAGIADIEITNAIGQVVYRGNTGISQKQINTQVSLDNSIANGVYMLKLTAGGAIRNIQFAVSR